MKDDTMETNEEKGKRALDILDTLVRQYPEAGPLLNFRNPFELLVATVLAAQCTDEMVNRVTEKLFVRYPGPSDLAGADQEELEGIIRPTGFFHNKANSLLKMAKALAKEHGGEVPGSIEELTKLPGVGRKTANVVAGNCFGRPAVIVDTHFKRVSGRLGLTALSNPDKIEIEIRSMIPEDSQTRFSHVVNFHGRYCCRAKKPDCPVCKISTLCPYPEKTK